MIIRAECDQPHPCLFYKKPWMSGVAGKCQDKFNYCVNDFQENMVSMSHTCKEEFVHCRYAFYLRYILGVNVREELLGEPLLAGRIWDNFVGAYHLGTAAPKWPPFIQDKLGDKVRALIKVHSQFVEPNGGHGYKAQHWIKLVINGVQIAGAVDRAYDDHFVETKLSGRPDFYLKPHNMVSQLGTYFLSNPKWEYAIMEVTRMPNLYQRNDESREEYYKRVYQDIVKRPSFYFPGLDRSAKTFGIRVDRSDINLERVEREYSSIIDEMRLCLKTANYYHQYAGCHQPYECSYLPICTTDTISETIYTTGGSLPR